MTEIEYEITQIYREHDRYALVSHTAWLGNLVLSEEEFDGVGRPTVGDVLILSLRPSEQKVKTDE